MLNFLDHLGSSVLTFLQGLPASAWTVIGVALGAIGALGIEKFKQKAEREKEARRRSRDLVDRLTERRRDSYLEVIRQSRDLRENTTLLRVTAVNEDLPSKERYEALFELTTRLTSLNDAILRASIESDDDMRVTLKMLHRAAGYETHRDFTKDGSGVSRDEFGTDFPDFGDAINDLDKAVHRMFAPELIYPTTVKEGEPLK